MIIPEVVFKQLSSWGWAHSCSKHVEDSNKHIVQEIVCQVGYLSEEFWVLFMFLTQVFFFFFPLEDLRKCNTYDIRLRTRDFWRWCPLPLYNHSQLATHFTCEALNNLTTIVTTSCFKLVRTEHLWHIATDICLRVLRSTNMATSGELYMRLCLQNKQNRTTPKSSTVRNI